MDYTDIIYSAEAGVARITINRPEVHNAFRLETLDQLAHAFEQADGDTSVGVMILTGAGTKAFSSGGDVNSESDFNYHNAWIYNRRLLHLAATMRNSAKPIIARIDGWCVGGGNELNLLCDLAIATESSRFGQAGSRVGSVPIWYGTQILPRFIGERKAKEVLFLCKQYSAAEAKDLGWINEVVTREELDAKVDEWAQELLRMSPTALMIAKLFLNHEADTSYPTVVGGFRMLNVGLHGSPEQHEGMTAFLEKRPPDFTRFRGAGPHPA